MACKAHIGQKAPTWSGKAVVKGEFVDMSSANLGGKYWVLLFYPADFTFVCPTEIIAFSSRLAEFKELNCEVIACSTDTEFTHLAWTNVPKTQGGLGSINIPLLSDKTHSISTDYGVLKSDEGTCYRGLFIVDSGGVLRQITINDMPVGRSVDECVRLIKAIQFTEEFGEVCPANWKPGAPTIKPTPDGSKDYFSKVNKRTKSKETGI